MTVQSEQVAHSQLVGGVQTALHSHAGGGSQPDIPVTLRIPTTDQTIAAGYSGYVTGDYEIAPGFMLELSADGIFEIG